MPYYVRRRRCRKIFLMKGKLVMSAMPAECKPLTGHGEHGLIEERGMDVR